jgi:uncharacterized protein YbaP (TraB family)
VKAILRTKGRRRAAVLFAWAWLVSPTMAEEAPPADKIAVCAGRDLSRDVDPDALARASEQRHDQLDNAQGLLWRVEKPPAAPSYLFGTIHSTDERAAAIAKTAAAHIAGAKVVATELGGPFDTLALTAMGAMMAVKALAREGDTLAGIGAPADLTLVENYLATRGVNAATAHHMRLWFLAALTATPPCEVQRQQTGLRVVDDIVARTARDLGVKVVGLETVAEQTDALASLDPSVSAAALISAARRPELGLDAYATLLSLYVQGKPGEILPVIDASHILTPQESAADDEMTRQLLGARNKIMVERISPLLESGGAFVAVGALHLVGKGGLVALLREAGYSVNAVP